MALQSIGVVFITHSARQHLPFCLPPVMNSPLKKQVLVVNSSSDDGTVELAHKMGAETLVIPRHEFNHGATRERARRHIGTDIVVMMTPDAYAVSETFLEELIQPLRGGLASMSYARQIPHEAAGFLESFPRSFNYSDVSQIRGKDDIPRYGSFTFFCSNACAAWVNAALDDVGGFATVLTMEDTLAAARLIANGYRIAYVAESVVRHSHRYSLMGEFRRYFDTGFARYCMGQDVMLGQRDEDHGKKFVASMLAQLWRNMPGAIPYALCNVGARYAGYQTGRLGHLMPLKLRKLCSGQDYYWSSCYADGNR